MKQLRNILNAMNMTVVAKEAGIPYNTVKNFKSGRKEHLTADEFNKVVEAIRTLTNLGGIR